LPGGLPAGILCGMAHYDGDRVLWDDRSVHGGHTRFGRTRYQPGGYCGPRVQRDFELVVLHSGDCAVEVEGRCRALHPGVAYLFLPGRREHFRFSTEHETHHSWCSVRPQGVPVAMRRRLARAPFGAPYGDVFERLWSSAFLVGEIRSPSGEQLVDQLGLAVFACFLAAAERARARTREDLHVARAVQYMTDHFAEPDCLEAAQRVAGCCRNLLIQKFSQQTGLTPARYLWKLRTEKGLALLAETGLTNAEIAERCGFKNPFHFSRLVRQHQGHPPREVRRRSWAG